MAYRKITEERKSEIVRYRRKNTVVATAQKFRVSISTVSNYWNDPKIKFDAGRRIKNEPAQSSGSKINQVDG